MEMPCNVQFGLTKTQYERGHLRVSNYSKAKEVHLVLNTSRQKAGRVLVALSPKQAVELLKELAGALGKALPTE
jgi:hypothetical protein